jgi:predicted nucleic acid-binding protein
MKTMIDAKDVGGIKGRKILFDTNIWLILNGPYFGTNQFRQDVYSEAYKALRERNTIITNEYILSEFCNRYVKLEYDYEKRASGLGDKFPNFKSYRKTDAFRPAMEAARDTCLNFAEDCEFMPISHNHGQMSGFVEEFCDGVFDMSDLMLRDHCKKEGLFLMTDDRDFAGCGVTVITANKRALKAGTF